MPLSHLRRIGQTRVLWYSASMAQGVRGLFITFEGVEGAGKSTQIALLRASLEQEGYSVRATREPGGDPVAERVRALILGQEMNARTELLLLLAARAQNVEAIIRPHLAQGGIVLCDRFIDSSVAYQGVARGLGRDVVAHLNMFAVEGVTPDLTVLLDLPPEVGLARQADRNRMESESLAFHMRVRQGFLAESANDPLRFLVLDALQSPEALHALIREQVRQRLAATDTS